MVGKEQTIAQAMQAFTTDSLTPVAALALVDEARLQCPVAFSREKGGFYFLMNHKDVRQAALDWRTFASGPSARRPIVDDPMKFAPTEFDPPESTFYRQVMIQGASPSLVARAEPLVRNDVVKHLDAMARRGRADIVSDLGDSIPVRAIFHVLGIDEGHDWAYAQTRALFQSSGQEFSRIYRLITDFAWDQVELRRREPREDFLTLLGSTKKDGRLLTKDEIGVIMISLITGGGGTSAAVIASMLYEVLSRPDVKSKLRNDRSLIPAAIEESIRLHNPSFGIYRMVAKEVTIGGTTLPEKSSVLLGWQAANLDPAVFDDPKNFRLDRDSSKHLAFGIGRHSCLGAPLARMELRVVLEEVLQKYPNMELANHALPDYKFMGTEFCGMTSLEVSFL